MTKLKDYTSIASAAAEETVVRVLPGARGIYCDIAKPLFDGMTAAVALMLCTPLLVFVAIVVKMETPGPVFFRQHRRGFRGHVFSIWKFRTMFDGRQSESAVTQTVDLRITRVGKFLRDSKIDELPQLFNIIMGDMSIIGPRPLSEHESRHIEDLGFPTEHAGFRHDVRPGLIGLEQMKRSRLLSYSERFELNRIYAENVNAGLDIYIFFVSLIQCRFVCSLAAISAVAEGFLLLR